MERNFKALSPAMAAAVDISGQARCSADCRPVPAATSETTAQQTEFMTSAAENAAPGGTSGAETRMGEERMRRGRVKPARAFYGFDKTGLYR